MVSLYTIDKVSIVFNPLVTEVFCKFSQNLASF